MTDGPRLGPVGQRLWDELGGPKAAGGRRALALEAARIADRLDQLDRLLTGEIEDLLRFKLSDDGTEVTVNVAAPLSEARQQASVLKQLIAELRQGANGKPATGGSVLDQLAAKRAARRANATG